jgi:hypothetical protein
VGKVKGREIKRFTFSRHPIMQNKARGSLALLFAVSQSAKLNSKSLD